MEVSRLRRTWTDVEWTTRLSVGGVTVRSLLASIDLFKWFVVVVVFVAATLRIRPSPLNGRPASASSRCDRLSIHCLLIISPAFQTTFTYVIHQHNVNSYHYTDTVHFTLSRMIDAPGILKC